MWTCLFKCQVRLKCVQSLTSIAQLADRDLAHVYIQCLAPRIMEHLKLTASTSTDTAISDSPLTLDEIAMMETLIAVVDDSKRKRGLCGDDVHRPMSTLFIHCPFLCCLLIYYSCV